MVAILDILGDHLVEDGVQFAGRFRANIAERRDRLFPVRENRPHHRLALVHGPARQQIVQRAPQRIDVGAMVGRSSVQRLFRSHVLGGSHDRAGGCQFRVGRYPAFAGHPREPHVQNLHHTLRVEQEIGRLDVAMHDPDPMGISQAACRLQHAVHGQLDRQRPLFLDPLRQVAPVDVLHDQKMDAVRMIGVLRPHNVRVVQLAGRSNFPLETLDDPFVLHHARRQQLDGHDPVQQPMTGPKHLPHPASPDLVQQHVVAEHQRLGFAAISLLRLKPRQLLLPNQFPSQLMRILRLRFRGKEIAQRLRVEDTTFLELLGKMLQAGRHDGIRRSGRVGWR